MATDTGRERVAARLEETTNHRKAHLAEVLEIVEEASSLAAAAVTDDLVRTCRRLGLVSHPDGASLYDGTNWSFGSPILHEDRLAAITSLRFDGWGNNHAITPWMRTTPLPIFGIPDAA